MTDSKSGVGGLVVRPALPEDLDRLWELVLELADYERLTHIVTGTREQLGELLFGPRRLLEGRLAEQRGRAIGYALFYTTCSSFRTKTRLWLEDLYVEPAQRGSGAGVALMREVARVAVERGCEGVQWDVLDWNEPAIAFYRRLGAVPEPIEWTQFGIAGAELQALAKRPDEKAARVP